MIRDKTNSQFVVPRFVASSVPFSKLCLSAPKILDSSLPVILETTYVWLVLYEIFVGRVTFFFLTEPTLLIFCCCLPCSLSKEAKGGHTSSIQCECLFNFAFCKTSL